MVSNQTSHKQTAVPTISSLMIRETICLELLLHILPTLAGWFKGDDAWMDSFDCITIRLSRDLNGDKST